jgi:hypothetical protein
MADPEAADHGEAQEVREHLGPGVDEEVVQLRAGEAGRDVETEDEQRDRDREHAVRERDEARELDGLPHGLAALLHPRISMSLPADGRPRQR